MAAQSCTLVSNYYLFVMISILLYYSSSNDVGLTIWNVRKGVRDRQKKKNFIRTFFKFCFEKCVFCTLSIKRWKEYVNFLICFRRKMFEKHFSACHVCSFVWLISAIRSQFANLSFRLSGQSNSQIALPAVMWRHVEHCLLVDTFI